MNMSLRDLQLTELQILVDFDKVCKENNLRYYLIGGALLGAVRYGRFIPWDDDIDVAMPREDYERLKEVALPKQYFLQNEETDPLFSRCIQKIRLHNTRIIEKNCQDVNIHQGIYIDVFPIDYVEDISLSKMARRARRICRLMSLRTIKGGYQSKRYRRIKNILRYGLPISTAYIDRTIYKLCTKENQHKRNYAILWLHNYSWDKQLHRYSVFEEGSTCEFEGYEFIAPAKKDEFLRRVFGDDYMQEPKKEKRRNPHNYLNINSIQ